MKRSYLLAAALAGCGVISRAAAPDPFAEGVRTTEPLSPQQQQATFKLPPGFEAQLVAAEPQIFKPMNLAFDARGRLWVTDSLEYPFPVKPSETGRDTIKILEDTNGDGAADKVTTFAEGLNIPIGILPYKNGAIAWSIPNIWYFEDTDGDNKADKRTVIFGPLGWERDTHGNIASLRRGFDGWLYGTHGFNNNSTFRGTDGSELTVNSGNVWRGRLDGSHVEGWSFGQVNPFGLAFDPAGNLYSADCHSSPIYQLIRGAYYPSFGKPHDGLGFGPVLMQHSHGSTAIAGVLYYADDLWPADFKDNLFVGNVMTSRINRDTLQASGSSYAAKEAPDFISTTDPWFRPVDMQLGPDGALYIADFYNRIIGHYEVSLQHPGRDRHRGRIWRVSYKDSQYPLPAFRDLTKATLPELTTELNSRNTTRRMLAMNEMVDRFGSTAAEPMRQLLMSDPATNQTVHALWVLHRVGGVPDTLLERVSRRGDTLMRTHVMRVLAETRTWTSAHEQLAIQGLNDADPNVARAAADAVGQHLVPSAIPLLVQLRTRSDSTDTHLIHTVRIALRNQLRGAGAFKPDLLELPQNQASVIADVSLGIQSVEASRFLLGYIQKFTEPAARVREYLRHITTYLPVEESVKLVDFVTRRFEQDLDLQLDLFKALQEGMARRGVAVPEAARDWGSRLAQRLLASAPNDSFGWRNFAVDGLPASANPWRFENRQLSDGRSVRFVTSYAAGAEELTGNLRSQPFRLPPELRFLMAGHDGYPDQPAGKKNFVRLRLVDGDQVIHTAAAPRNDTPISVRWDLSAHQGQNAYMEVVDGDTGTGYAWIAIAEIDPPVVRLPQTEPRQILRRQVEAAALARSLQLTNSEPALVALLQNSNSDMEARAAAAITLASFRPNEQLAAVANLAGDPAVPAELRNKINRVLTDRTAPMDLTIIPEVFRTAPQRVQRQVAESLAGSLTGAELLLQMIAKGEASQRLLTQQSLRDRLAGLRAIGINQQLEQLLAKMPPLTEEADKLIEERRKSYASARTDLTRGARLFNEACAVCHQVAGQGKVIGPQLDGIGNRGLERILEDIIDPNRNVDVSFRTTVITLKNGDVISGLVRREEGALLIVADAAGNETQVRKSDIQSQEQTASSLMPANFGEALSAEDFNHLLGYLLNLRK